MRTTDQQLRSGLLAVELRLISPDDLLGAIAAWRDHRNQSLRDVLLARELIDKGSYQSLVQLVEKRQALGEQLSLRQVFAGLPGGREIERACRELADEDLNQTLGPGGAFSTRGPDRAAGSAAEFSPAEQSFHVLHLHAQGGLGEVWLAEDRALKRQVAIKKIRSEHADHAESRGRFLQEAEITGRLEHPGVVPIYALGQSADGRPYYAMRFIRGRSLSEEVDRYHATRGGKVTGGAAAPTLRQLLARFVAVCEAIAYAHSRGVLHRDLKPENIMLGLYGETLVVDWGLAKAEGEQSPNFDSPSAESRRSLSGGTPTRLGSALGTPGYMSPEQAQGAIDELSPATDIYSLGATLFYMLTGRAPIQGQTVTDIIENTCWGKIPAPRSLVGDIPRPLESICLQALRLEANQRYATALELAADIQHFLDDEPVAAHHDSATERASRLVRQHKTGVVAAAATLAVIAVVSIVASVMIAKSRNLAVQLAADNADLAAEERQSREVAQQLQYQAELATATARRQQARAEKYYGLAINTVDRFLTNVADDDRLKAYGLESLRRDLLVEAQDFYELVIEQADAGEDPLHARRANTHQRLADLQFEVGAYDKAVEAYESALLEVGALPEEDRINPADALTLRNDMGLALDAAGQTDRAIQNWRDLIGQLAEFVHKEPGNPDYHGLLATVKLNLAHQLELRAPADSIALSVDAKRQAGRAIELQPEESGYRDTLALIHNNLARTLIQQERFAEADDELRAAATIWQSLAAESEGWRGDFYAGRLALVYLNQATLAVQKRDGEAATLRLRQALDIRQQIAGKHPDSVQPQALLAQLHHSAAKHYRTLIRYNASLQQTGAALEIYRRLNDTYPAALDYQRDMALVLIDQGLTQLAMGNRSEAEKPMRQAIELSNLLAQESRQQSDYRRPRVISRYYLGLVCLDGAQAEQAVELLRLAAAEMADLVAALDEDLDLMIQLADCQATLGALYEPEIIDDEQESQAWWTAALATCDRLLSEEFRGRLPPSVRTKVQMRRAEALTGRKQYSQALASWERVFAASQGEVSYEFGSGKATTLFRAGRYGESLELSKETASRLKHPRLVYAIAREIALGLHVLAATDLPVEKRSAWTDAYSATSIELLQRAAELGYFANEETRNFLAEDNYLDPLRNRQDFQSFLEKVAQ